MLKDITLGQYFPGDTFVHRLDPRTKLVSVILYIAALFTAKYWISYALIAAAMAVSVAATRIRLSAYLKGLKPVIIILIITALLNLFYTAGGRTVVSFWRITITTGGIQTAFFMVTRVILLIVGTLLLTYTTSPIALTDGMESLLSPLKKLKVPIHEIAMMMSIALRFIPTLIEETDKIMSAQKARGADFDTGNLIQKAKAMLPLLIPLFVSAFRRADELAVAMESRCYHGGEGRTRMNVLRLKTRDWTVLAAWVVFLSVVSVLVRHGL